MESIHSLSNDARRLLASLTALPAPTARPGVVLVCGLPGTGKTTLSKCLAERLPLAHLESDACRKVLFPQPRYTATESARLFGAIHQALAHLLAQGRWALFDATNAREDHRQVIYHIAQARHAAIVIVETVAPPPVVRQWLASRPDHGDGGNSDADWVVYRRIEATWQPIKLPHFAVDTSQDVTPALERIAAAVQRLLGG